MKQTTLDNISKVLAEVIGTALLLFLGCMGCATNMGVQNNHLQMVVTFGLVVMLVIQIFGCTSGSHINPVVTVCAYIYKRISFLLALAYIVAQILGAFIGFGLLKIVSPANVINNSQYGLCTTVPNPNISSLQAVLVEYLISMVLVLVCCGVWDPRNNKYHDSVPLRFGLAITALAAAAGPWTGGSMNPARSLGPAIWNGEFKQHWVYWVGPLSAAVITTYGYRAVFYRESITPIKEELPLNS